MFICKYCGKEFETKQKLGGHVSSHFRGDEYSKKRKKKIEKKKGENNICCFCGEKIENGLKLGAHITNCKLNPNRNNIINKIIESRKNYKITDETKNKISESMKVAHKEKRAWNIGMSRWNNEKSYPEKFFGKVIENEFNNKDYTSEYPISIYSLDFAWVDLKKGIEIDGEQHERFEEYRNRDNIKDRICKEMGWEILRIKWKDLYNDTKNMINIARIFIDGK